MTHALLPLLSGTHPTIGHKSALEDWCSSRSVAWRAKRKIFNITGCSAQPFPRLIPLFLPCKVALNRSFLRSDLTEDPSLGTQSTPFSIIVAADCGAGLMDAIIGIITVCKCR